MLAAVQGVTVAHDAILVGMQCGLVHRKAIPYPGHRSRPGRWRWSEGAIGRNRIVRGRKTMTWVIGAASLFGYGVMLSDVRVSFPNGQRADMLKKAYPVGPFHRGRLCWFGTHRFPTAAKSSEFPGIKAWRTRKRCVEAGMGCKGVGT